MNNKEFLTFILDRLSSRFPLKARSMFGGYGLYCDKGMIGLIAESKFFLKGRGNTGCWFQERGSTPFTYDREGKSVSLCYWHVPEEILETQGELATWFLHAYHNFNKS